MRWIQVTAHNQCPICNHDHWCSIADNGSMAACYRVDDGTGLARVDSAGYDFWLYILDKTHKPRIDEELPPAPPKPEPPDIKTLHNVYSELLANLYLSKVHQEDLLKRGIKSCSIQESKYRTLPLRGRADLAKQLLSGFSVELLLRVPGFYIKEQDNKRWLTVAGASGLVIPVRNCQGLITGLKVRSDDPKAPAKYTSISSAKYGGSGPGAQVHVPKWEGPTDTIRITEGELKAEVATTLTATLTLSVPGVSAYRAVLPVLKELQAKKVLLAFDADFRENEHVAKALGRAYQTLSAEGYDVTLELWPLSIAKGIDDLLVLGQTPDALSKADAEGVVARLLERSEPATETAKTVSQLEQARALAEILRGKAEAGSADDAISDLLGDPERVKTLAVLMNQERSTFESLALKLKEEGATPSRVTALKSSVRSEANKRPALVEAKPGDRPTLQPMSNVLDYDSIPIGMVVPDRFRVSINGIYMEKTNSMGFPEAVQISTAPVWISKRLTGITDGVEHLEIAWPRDGRVKTEIVERKTLASNRLIIELAQVGLPVDSGTASDMVAYFSALEAANAQVIPLSQVTSTLGWNGTYGFLCGEMQISARDSNLVFRGLGPGDRQIAEGFSTAGTLEDWLQGIAPVEGYPYVMFAIYTSLAAPMLDILNANNFVLSLDARSSKGKTTTARIAASVWGQPDEKRPGSVVGSWGSTFVGIMSRAVLLNGLPLILDDTKRISKPEDMISRTLYTFTSGQDKARGTRGASLQQVRTFRSIMISTGETAITNYTNDQGVVARVLELLDSPFGSGDASEVVNELNFMVMEHYGHAGPLFVRYLMDHKSEWTSWRERYRGYVKELQTKSQGDAIAKRASEYLATAQITMELAHEAISFPWELDTGRLAISAIMGRVSKSLADGDRELKAFEDVISWITSSRAAFMDSNDSPESIHAPSNGWLGRWVSNSDSISIFPHKIKDYLKSRQYEPESILREWKARGWILGDGEGKTSRLVKLGAKPVRMIVILQCAIDNMSSVVTPNPLRCYQGVTEELPF